MESRILDRINRYTTDINLKEGRFDASFFSNKYKITITVYDKSEEKLVIDETIVNWTKMTNQILSKKLDIICQKMEPYR